MGEREEKVNKLAKSLHKSGFSISESSALEKAKEMIEIEEKLRKSQEKKGFSVKNDKKEEATAKPEDYDISKENKTVNEIMKEAGVSETEQPKEKEGIIKESNDKEEFDEDSETLEEEEGERIDIE